MVIKREIVRKGMRRRERAGESCVYIFMADADDGSMKDIEKVRETRLEETKQACEGEKAAEQAVCMIEMTR